MDLRISSNGINLIKKFEGFSSVLYDDVGHPAIGYGQDLTSDQAKFYKGKTITEQEATVLLLNHLVGIESCINKNVKTTINQNQYDALCSFTYNVGAGGFANSTLLKKINNKDYAGAANEFSKWNKVNGKDHPGLTARRAKEKTLFLT